MAYVERLPIAGVKYPPSGRVFERFAKQKYKKPNGKECTVQSTTSKESKGKRLFELVIT